MQKRPTLHQTYFLKERYVGVIQVDGWVIWTSMGTYLDFQGGRNQLHKHSYYEACLVLDGKGTFYHRRKNHPVAAGDLFIADPLTTHEIISDTDDHLRIQFIAFTFEGSGDSADQGILSSYIRSFLSGHTLITPGCEELEPLFSYMRTIGDMKPASRRELLYRSCAESIITSIISLSAKDTESITTDDTESRIQLAVRYINDNPRRKLSLEEIAYCASTSGRTLRRLMQKYYGMTVTEYCQKVRLQAAADHLLSHPGLSVSEVGYHFGFENPSDFTRSFRKVLGLPPGLFRESRGTIHN